MAHLPTIEPPEPLTPHEQSLTLVKSMPPQPRWAYLLLAALTSIGGLTMAWVYLKKDASSNRIFGLQSLLLAFVIPLIVVAIIIFIQIQQGGARAPLPDQPGLLLP